MQFTENGALAYSTTQNACLDFFAEAVPNIGTSSLQHLLSEAWREDPLIALKLVFHLGAVRDGKQDRRNFYVCMEWLKDAHIDTFLYNLRHVPDLVCWKSLLDLLLAEVEGLDFVLDYEDPNWYARRRAEVMERLRARRQERRQGRRERRERRQLLLEEEHRRMAEGRAEAGRLFVQACREKAAVDRRVKRAERAALLEGLGREGSRFAMLRGLVADLFADQLRQDRELMERKRRVVGLCAKWAPSHGHSYDKLTGITDEIVRRLYPESEFRIQGGGATADEFLSFMRDRFRKEYLTPLRRYQKVPETFMHKETFSSLPYERVPSVCMKLRKGLFEKHDKERFSDFLQLAKKGEKKLASGALLPHEIVAKFISQTFYRSCHQADTEMTTMEDDVLSLQWKSILDNLKETGALGSSIAVCDVSGSMSGRPMEVCIALGLLSATIASPPWRGRVLTFSSSPSLVHIGTESSSLQEQCRALEGIDWGGNTDFNRAFRRLLDFAQKHELPASEMVKQVLVFSDMEFDQAQGGAGVTNFEEARQDFEREGYTLPRLVFWNLRASTGAKPVACEEEGVALVSGFSKNLLKAFMEGGAAGAAKFTPLAVMRKELEKKAFQCLEVVETVDMEAEGPSTT
uniref:TROVE domain-containing protein n=1 Tax=Chromera velia CCMP2878 TaxID=1169474 RepID=A0A0G4FLX3_9ALVE|eukprot:Cvel_17693.t1-p1 / transcript=Cvel_17693.t1 / gene=Cvel_17693 / organism=Chromera_velia_CCMP2878 / gene_product=Uncharacterized protein L728, putative / transcript_product=Uncharacterized protein L728, putative / location=Cvel_scaffold1428:16589-18478(-) / protein_length=630 / sequence_SO=supercontig / SO=protein_coding / is_pseudo=false